MSCWLHVFLFIIFCQEICISPTTSTPVQAKIKHYKDNRTSEKDLEDQLVPGMDSIFPKVNSIKAFISVLNGQPVSVTVVCTATGNPPVDITIFMPDGEMRIEPRSHRKLEFTLTHTSYVKSFNDAIGVYKCKARNNNGESEPYETLLKTQMTTVLPSSRAAKFSCIGCFVMQTFPIHATILISLSLFHFKLQRKFFHKTLACSSKGEKNCEGQGRIKRKTKIYATNAQKIDFRFESLLNVQ
ncbi:hypothetical protein HELRODRAFT_183328 [Helobdella robusta]|uniref:Ig-like domain-containing protein n=1 Tax=Helobdella robusta TaxID=6412 RepID=T1FJG7_HELRO|nr:hypothetical protein HELRODRAFT_183328 [Helobdella robusta]ESO11315.1 hypothetical protein HELRODRAFT_183328 [Helobdella robusta]